MNISGAGSAQAGLLQSLGSTQRSMGTSAERVSTGQRVNRASDDPAGLAVLTGLIAQETGIEESMINIQSNAGMVQVGQAAADSITEAVQRARSLAVRSADGSLNDNDRSALNKEMQGLMREINETASRANYNGKPLLDGSLDLTAQVGANEGETQNLKIGRVSADTLFGTTPDNLSIATQEDASKFISLADTALDQIGGANLQMGAFNNSLDRTLDLQRQNLTATTGSRSALGDADFAREITNKTIQSILDQSNLAMVAQNNANASTVLRLFG